MGGGTPPSVLYQPSPDARQDRPAMTPLPRRLLVTLAALAVAAADWPQWRGPQRDGKSAETNLLRDWPKSGPKLLWQTAEAGLGYSGPAVAGDKLFGLGATENGEFAFCLEAATGKQVWRTEIGKYFDNDWGGGPRSTPALDGDRVYVLGANGDLACLEAGTGRKVWAKNLESDFGGKYQSSWGYSESPLIDGDKLICSPGGKRGTVAALSKADGALVWRAEELTDDASYASAVPATLGGVHFYALLLASGPCGVAADTGKVLFRSTIAANPVAVIPTPVVDGSYLYASSGYNAGCGLLELAAADGKVEAKEVYRDKNMINHHGGIVKVGDYVYGYTDKNRGSWACQEFKTGKLVWTSTKLDKGSVLYADGRLWCYGQKSGDLACVEATPAGWTEVGRFTLPKKTNKRKASGGIWTHPVVANGVLYLRDQELLYAFDVRG